MKSYLLEGGQSPMIIGGNDGNDTGGGGVLIILLFLIIIAVVALPLMNRREPIANSNAGGLAEILPAMMLMQQTSRQNVNVDSYNNGAYNNNCGPTNFDIYRQGVATNDNVFAQSAMNKETTLAEACKTRELVYKESSELKNLIKDNTIKQLERELDERSRQLIQRDNQLITSAQFNGLTEQHLALTNRLSSEIVGLRGLIPERPVKAEVVGSCYPTVQIAPPTNYSYNC